MNIKQILSVYNYICENNFTTKPVKFNSQKCVSKNDWKA